MFWRVGRAGKRAGGRVGEARRRGAQRRAGTVRARGRCCGRPTLPPPASFAVPYPPPPSRPRPSPHLVDVADVDEHVEAHQQRGAVLVAALHGAQVGLRRRQRRGCDELAGEQCRRRRGGMAGLQASPTSATPPPPLKPLPRPTLRKLVKNSARFCTNACCSSVPDAYAASMLVPAFECAGGGGGGARGGGRGVSAAPDVQAREGRRRFSPRPPPPLTGRGQSDHKRGAGGGGRRRPAHRVAGWRRAAARRS
jgi:hypothetical protein